MALAVETCQGKISYKGFETPIGYYQCSTSRGMAHGNISMGQDTLYYL